MSDNQAEQLAALRTPFGKEVVGKLPRGGINLDYVGHAAVTDRLLSVDPCWNWEPLSYDADGQPMFDRNQGGHPVGLWIKLTVAGVTRLGYGSCAPKADAPKELIGDALRNAAMRFGVALDLWTKDELESHVGEGVPKATRPARQQQQRPAAAPASKSGGGGELSGGNAEALAPAPAGQPSPADVIGALTLLDPRSRAVVRGKWGQAGVNAESDPSRAMALLREVADA